MGSNQQPLDSKPNALPTELRRETFFLNFYYTALYIATMLHLFTESRGRPVASSMYFFNKTENIAVDEIGEIICSYLLARAQ